MSVVVVISTANYESISAHLNDFVSYHLSNTKEDVWVLETRQLMETHWLLLCFLLGQTGRQCESGVVRRQRFTHTCWKRLMLSRMLNCCQRLEKFTLPSIKSGFPRWTNVRSCRIKPLSGNKKKKKTLFAKLLHYLLHS